MHLELGANMVPFAGYDMPASYLVGILPEHRHCRASAALFDLSHMGQLRLPGATRQQAEGFFVEGYDLSEGGGHRQIGQEEP